MAARIQTGDEVVVISGKWRGKTGKVVSVLREEDKVIVQGVNLVTKHVKPSARDPQGGIVKKEAALHACKVMPVDPKTGKGTRVRFRKEADGAKVRVAAKSGEVLPRVKAE
jgi:large subunit ribosomal protein L24